MPITLPGGTRTYQTAFPTVESPLSEGGVWTSGIGTNLDWTNVITDANGIHGTMDGHGGPPYNDSIASLKGAWGADQIVSAVVYSNASIGGELELQFRTTDAAHWHSGYEIGLDSETANPNYELVRLNGPPDDFTMLQNDFTGNPAFALHDGDVVTGTMIGTVITLYINGVQVAQYDTAGDAVKLSSGNPGVGFYYYGPDPVNANARCGWRSFFAADGIGNYAGINHQTNPGRCVVALPRNVQAGNTVLVCCQEYQYTPGANAVTKSSGTATVGTITRNHYRAGSAGVVGIAFYSVPITGSGSLALRYDSTTERYNITLAMAEFAGVRTPTATGLTDTNSGTGTTESAHSLASGQGSLLLFASADSITSVLPYRLSDQFIYINNDPSYITQVIQYKIPRLSPNTLQASVSESSGWVTAAAEYLPTISTITPDAAAALLTGAAPVKGLGVVVPTTLEIG